jgi:hypothetical protein
MEKIKISKHILSARGDQLNAIAIKEMLPQVLRAGVFEPPLNLDYARFDKGARFDGGDYARFDSSVRSSGSRELGYFKRL